MIKFTITGSAAKAPKLSITELRPAEKAAPVKKKSKTEEKKKLSPKKTPTKAATSSKKTMNKSAAPKKKSSVSSKKSEVKEKKAVATGQWEWKDDSGWVCVRSLQLGVTLYL